MTNSVRNAGLCAAMAMLGSAVGAQTVAEQFHPIEADAGIKPFISRSTDTTPTTVVVLLSGEPVAAVQRQLGRKLDQGERDSIIAAREAEHQGSRPSIESLGGTVLAHLHSALNGVKVKIAKNRLAALRRLPGVVDIQAVGTYERVN